MQTWGTIMSQSFGNMDQFVLPHKPDDMALEVWTALLQRSGGRCELGCATQCDTRLEVDHVHSRALGGETSLRNCRLLCANANRARGVALDPKWEAVSYFDTYNSFGQLRSSQLALVTDIKQYADLFVGDLRRRLLASISLYALVCGAGKTLLMASILFAINEQVNLRSKHLPRPTKVLWFVKERVLAVMLKGELESEITKINLHYAKPSVQICSESGDLDRGPMHHDITISCPHALWRKKRR
jgi:hypothetical protein